MRRIVSGILLTMLLTSMLTLPFNIQTAKAEPGTIYIRADGSIDPPTAPIQRNGGIYTLTDNIYDSIVVQRSNIIIDGAGYTVQGSGSVEGFVIVGVDNVTIKNTNIKGFRHGVHIELSSFNTVCGNKITNCDAGIVLHKTSNYNNISGNNIIANIDGIELVLYPTNNSISGNAIIANQGAGILLSSCSNNIVSGNYIANNNMYGIYLYGSSNNIIFHNNFINNTLQGYLYYSYSNIWDDSYPSGGNYWSDYAGVDANGDGIGDTPYIIDADNRDRYPLVRPWTPTPPAPDFSITASLNSLSIQQGSSDTSTITLTSMNSFNQPVQLTVSGAPSGVTATFSPQQVTPPAGGSTTSTLAVSVGTSATLGSYTLTVTGNSGALTHSTYISLEITSAPTSEQPQLRAPWVGIARVTQGNNGGTSHYDHGTWDNTYAIDVALPVDSDVLAPYDGTVKYVDNDPNGAGGKELALEHTGPTGKKFITVYLHLDGILVTDGDLVKQGQVVAKSGATGIVTGPHLHFHLWRPKGSEPEWAFDSHTMPIERLVMKQVGVDSDFREYDARKGELDNNGIAGKVFESNARAYCFVPYKIKVMFAANDVREMVLDEYLKGVVSAEMSSGWPIQALKAQAVAARTVAVRTTQHNHVTEDVCTNPAHCQAWKPPPYNQDIENAVSQTHNEVITYHGWILKNAMFFAWCNGHTIDSEDRFPDSKPYLRGVSCNGEKCKQYRSLYNPEKCPYLTYGNDISKCDCKPFDEHDPGTGGYCGHRVGMCQEGAKTMAQNGYGYVDIIKHYYTDVDVLTAVTAERRIVAKLQSPGELSILDSQNRVTGLLNGSIRSEIPNSEYDEANELVTIFLSNDQYRFIVAGTDLGSYGLIVANATEQGTTVFESNSIPIKANAIHQYTIDWDALSRGEEGVTVEVDLDGDGVPEHTFTSGVELTQNDFMTVLCDVDADGKVDIRDIGLAARAFGTSYGDVRWNPMPDINADNHVDLRDIAQIARHFGQHYP